MTRTGWRGARRALLFIALVGASVVLFLRTQLAADQACQLARRNLPALLDLDVGIGSCELDPLEQRVTLKGVSVFEPGSDESLFAADEVEVGFRGLRLTGVDLELVRVVHPRIRVDARVTRKARGGACPLEALRHVGVRRLDIKGGELHLALPEGRSLDLAGIDVSWKVRRGLAELNAAADRGLLGLGHSNELPLSRLSVEGGFDADALRLEVSRAEIALDEATLNVTGRVDDLCAPLLALDGQAFVPLRTLAKLLPLGDDASGHLWTRIVASGPVSAPRLTADLVGTKVVVNRFEPGDFKARLSLVGNDLKLDELSFAAGAGTARVEGSMKLAPTLPVKLRLDVQDAEFGRILERASVPGSWVDFLATGKASVSGHLLPAPHLTGEADLHATRFSLTAHPFDSPTHDPAILAFPRGRVVTGLKIQADRVEFTDAKVEAEHSRVATDVTLFYDVAKGIEVRGTADALDLSDFGQISGIRWAGKGSGHFAIQGPLANVHIDSELSLRDFLFWNFSLGVVQAKVQYDDNSLIFPTVTGQKGKTVYSASGALDFRPESQGGMHAKGQAFVFDGRTEDLLDMIAALDSNIPLFQGPLVGDADGAVLIDCPVAALDGVVKLNMRNTTYYGRRLGDGDAVLRFAHGQSMVLEKASLTGPMGTLSADGTLNFGGSMDYRFRGDGLSVEELFGPERAKKLGLSGALTLVGKAEGDGTTPVVSAYLTSPTVAFAGRDLGDMHLEGRILGKELQVWGRPVGGARANLHVKLKDPFPYDGQLSLTLPEIRPLLPEGAVAQGLSGSLSGSLTGSGTLAGAQTVQAHATIDKLTLSRGDFQGANDGPLQFSYENGWLGVDAFAFKAPNTQIVAAGAAGPDSVDLSVHGSLDMRLLESFVPALERTSGRVELAASLGGTPQNPTLVGSAELQDARFSVRDQALSFRAVTGRADFSDSRILLNDFHGVMNNDGRVALDGDLRLDRLKVSQFQVRMQLDDVTFSPMDDLPVTTTGELMLHGRADAPVLSGDLDIQKLRYDRPLELDTFVKQMLKPQSVINLDKGRAWLTLDVRLRARDVRIDNNLAKVRILGDLKVTGTNLKPGLVGTLEAGEGSQFFFRQNQFAITQAQFDFKDRQPVDPFVDVKAETQVRDYVVKMHAFGYASDPQLVLKAEPELSKDDVLSLLTLGITSHDKSNTAGAGLGLAAEAVFYGTGLDRVAQHLLPKNRVIRDLSFHMATTYNEGTGVVESAAQLESKLITDKLTLRASQPVSGRGTKAQLEYLINNRLSAQFQWDNVESDYSFGNLGGLLKWRGEVE